MSAIGMVVHRYVSCWTGNQKLSPSLHLFDGSVPTLVFTEIPHAPLPNVEYLPVSDYRQNILPEIMEMLYTRGLQSLLVEGGSQTLQSFIDAGLWDEIFVEEAPHLLHSGVKAPEISDGYPFATEYSFGRSFRIIRPQETANSLISGLFYREKGGYYL